MENLSKHLIKALDSYPYDMEECWESLQYALSADENALAFCLMGRIYSDQFRQYEKAKVYFQEALAVDMSLVEIYPYYISTLISNEDYEEADRLISFAFDLKGMDKGSLWYFKALLAEVRRDYIEALEHIKNAVFEGYNDDYISTMKDMKSRVKKKIKLKSKKKKKAKVNSRLTIID